MLLMYIIPFHFHKLDQMKSKFFSLVFELRNLSIQVVAPCFVCSKHSLLEPEGDNQTGFTHTRNSFVSPD